MTGAGAPSDIPDISVIAVSWNTAGCLPAALDSIKDACGDRRWEAIVVDNGSSDASVDILERRHDATVIPLSTNTGFTHAANIGADATRGRYLVFLNPDVVLTAGSLAQLADLLDARPEAWGATPWFLNPDGSPQHFWRRMPGAGTVALCLTSWGRKLDRVLGHRAARRRNYRDLGDRPGTVAIEGVGAACLMVRRDDFFAVGRFDERFRNFFQDAAFERVQLRRGRLLLGVGHVDVTHIQGVTLKTMPRWEVDGQFLYDLRHYLADLPRRHRWCGEAAVRLDLRLPGTDRGKTRAVALRPLRERQPAAAIRPTGS